MSQVITYLLWFGAIGCGLLGGLYFAFSTFIMDALASIEQAHGISAMNSMNSTILKSLFMPFFFGTTLVSLIFVIVGIVRWGEPGSMTMLAGGLIYVAGMFLCTMFFQRASKQCFGEGRFCERSDGATPGSLPEGLDVLESFADDFV
jgi:uncharacterized membrane protein